MHHDERGEITPVPRNGPVVTDAVSRLTTTLSDRYRLERELGQGGMVRELVTEVTLKDSLTVAARRKSLKRLVSGFRGHFSDLSRALKDSLAPGSRWRAPTGCSVAVASATRSGDDPWNHDA
jgi:hypothetical protein